MLRRTFAFVLAVSSACGPPPPRVVNGFVVEGEGRVACVSDADCRVATDCCGRRYVIHDASGGPAVCKLGCGQSSNAPGVRCAGDAGPKACALDLPLDP